MSWESLKWQSGTLLKLVLSVEAEDLPSCGNDWAPLLARKLSMLRGILENALQNGHVDNVVEHVGLIKVRSHQSIVVDCSGKGKS